MIDWQKNCKDAMWSMYWLNPNPKSEDIDADCETVRRNVAKLVRMSTQKGGGLRGEKDMLNNRDLPLIEVQILIAVTNLALSGYFGPMPDKVSTDAFEETE